MPRPMGYALMAMAMLTFMVFLPLPATGLEIAPDRRLVGEKAPDAFVPYASSHPLSEPDPVITRILVVLHGDDHDALKAYQDARAAFSKAPKGSPETLIVSPQFLERKAIPGDIPDGLLFWQVRPFHGSSMAAIGPEKKMVHISAFDIMDDWLAALTNPELFPQLRDIVFFGHSAGGEFVQRYALVGKFDPPEGIVCRYVVSAPSSYAYPFRERFHPAKKRFLAPDANALSACPDVHKWGYGLDAPFGYFKGGGDEFIIKRYSGRTVFYLCGGSDTDSKSDNLDISCQAMMQGRHRLDRMQIFDRLLVQKFGASITRKHSFTVVQGVGHDRLGIMTSSSGLKALFPKIP